MNCEFCDKAKPAPGRRTCGSADCQMKLRFERDRARHKPAPKVATPYSSEAHIGSLARNMADDVEYLRTAVRVPVPSVDYFMRMGDRAAAVLEAMQMRPRLEQRGGQKSEVGNG